MRLAFFYDYGYIGYDSDRFEGNDILENDITRSSTGVVVEWQSGFGPINLVFAYPIDEKTGDRTSVFEFSMGTRFYNYPYKRASVSPCSLQNILNSQRFIFR